MKIRSFLACAISFAATAAWANPCETSMTHGAVCEEANQKALDLMEARKCEGIIVMQNVADGNIVVATAADPTTLDVGAPIQPLSSVKLLTAASCLEHKDRLPEEVKPLLEQMLVKGNDDAGRHAAKILRESLGTEAVLGDLQNYGFSPKNDASARDREFWAESPVKWLVAEHTGHSLVSETPESDWENILSLGEDVTTTALHLSRFLQMIGNGGTVVQPGVPSQPGAMRAGPARVVSADTALKLQDIMRETVVRGTAQSAAPILAGTGWTMGGKTGTGPGPEPPGPSADGIFAGLIFDPSGKARFTVVTFIRHGGLGGGNAAQISAEMGKFLAGQ